MISHERLRSFRHVIWNHYKKYGRYGLPWRKTHDPYRILVSEIMLQQTQVIRVIPLYTKFLKKFPTAQHLAAAPLSDVLKTWQGLGYNRRAKLLFFAAKEIIRNGMPCTIEELQKLSGVGPYTAAAITAFAFNKDSIVIETNIRTAIIYYFFPKQRKISDIEIATVLEEVLPKGRACEWYSALMDYGAFLKMSGVHVNEQSTHYVKQSHFVGSNRQIRGAILRELAHGAQNELCLLDLFDNSRHIQFIEVLTALQKEKLIHKRGEIYTLPR